MIKESALKMTVISHATNYFPTLMTCLSRIDRMVVHVIHVHCMSLNDHAVGGT